MANATQRDAQVDAMATYMLGQYAGSTDEAKVELLATMREALSKQKQLIETAIANVDAEMHP